MAVANAVPLLSVHRVFICISGCHECFSNIGFDEFMEVQAAWQGTLLFTVVITVICIDFKVSVVSLASLHMLRRKWACWHQEAPAALALEVFKTKNLGF